MAAGMIFEKHQICLCSVSVGKANYPRPCIILDIEPNGTLAILPISTKSYTRATMFKIDSSDSDFADTGLTETSYIFDSPVRDAAPFHMIKILGNLQGNLKARFIDWIGD